MYRKQLDEHFGNGKTAKEVIEVSAEPCIDELINQAIDHVVYAQRLIDKARFKNVKHGVVAEKCNGALIGADDMLKIAKMDLTMASICNEIL